MISQDSNFSPMWGRDVNQIFPNPQNTCNLQKEQTVPDFFQYIYPCGTFCSDKLEAETILIITLNRFQK